MLPVRVTVPAAGAASPASTRVSVVLPAPLRPTKPIRSPGATRTDAELSNSREPARSSRSVAVITSRVYEPGCYDAATAASTPLVGPATVPATTRSSYSRPISPADSPSTSARTSSVWNPSKGAGRGGSRGTALVSTGAVSYTHL